MVLEIEKKLVRISLCLVIIFAGRALRFKESSTSFSMELVLLGSLNLWHHHGIFLHNVRIQIVHQGTSFSFLDLLVSLSHLLRRLLLLGHSAEGLEPHSVPEQLLFLRFGTSTSFLYLEFPTFHYEAKLVGFLLQTRAGQGRASWALLVIGGDVLQDFHDFHLAPERLLPCIVGQPYFPFSSFSRFRMTVISSLALWIEMNDSLRQDDLLAFILQSLSISR